MDKATLYAAQIICFCQARLAVIDTGKLVNNAKCEQCGRQYQVCRVTLDKDGR